MTVGWQPIETAPKDGTFVLAFWWLTDTDVDYYPPEVVRWSSESEEWQDDYATEYLEPTHWMPLPDPPESP